MYPSFQEAIEATRSKRTLCTCIATHPTSRWKAGPLQLTSQHLTDCSNSWLVPIYTSGWRQERIQEHLSTNTNMMALVSAPAHHSIAQLWSMICIIQGFLAIARFIKNVLDWERSSRMLPFAKGNYVKIWWQHMRTSLYTGNCHNIFNMNCNWKFCHKWKSRVSSQSNTIKKPLNTIHIQRNKNKHLNIV